MNNTKTATIFIWATLVCFVGVTMFIMKYKVQSLESELIAINRNISNDIKTIHILKAEWSHLNSPNRLRNLASKHIALNQVVAEQIINYSVLPLNNNEDGDSNRKLAAKQKLSAQAQKNQNLRKLVNAER